MTDIRASEAAEALIPGLQYLQIEAMRARLPQVSGYLSDAISKIQLWISSQESDDS
jgi:hypothetical protein